MSQNFETSAKALAIAALSGLGFGLGLAVSGMNNPSKVIGFLDFSRIASGSWDPTLMFVMGGGLAVTFTVFTLLKRRERTLLGAPFHLPFARRIDWRLTGGSALFGIGWAISGACPGTVLGFVTVDVPHGLIMLAGVLAGMALVEIFLALLQKTQATSGDKTGYQGARN